MKTSDKRLLVQPSLEQMQGMLGFVVWNHVSGSVDADVSQRAALPPETTRPHLLVVLLLISEIWQTFPFQGAKDTFVADKVADLWSIGQ